MKKKLSILSLLLVFTMTAMAQIEFTHEDKVIPDGSEFNVYAHTEDFGFMKLIEYAGNDPYIKNTGSKATTISVTIKKEDANDAVNWCGVTGQCAFIPAGTKSASRSAKVNAGESIFLGAHYTFDEGDYKTVRLEVTASGGGVSRTIYMNIIYADAAGISGTQAENAVKLAGKQLNYNFNDNTERTISVYSTTGRLMKQESVVKSGTLSLAGLHKGVYLYAVTENGRRVATHKFILK